ncbi:MAG: hypothetical protein SFW63_03495 [Alphaproteobacteria bacterium]|nr:hypothetical protein [Alphaproteobacteria bacterium]
MEKEPKRDTSPPKSTSESKDTKPSAEQPTKTYRQALESGPARGDECWKLREINRRKEQRELGDEGDEICPD